MDPSRRARGACAVVLIASAVASTVALASPIEPCRPTVVCAVEVEELPAVLRSSGGYELGVSGKPAIPLPSSGVAHIAIAEPVVVRLLGPAYHGSVSIDPAECGGEAVHTIAAAPKPAKLIFQAGTVRLSELVISCVDGCVYRQVTADDFPELPFPRDELELVVKLEFKARGHRTHVAEYRLTPGDNQIRVGLERFD